MGSNDPGERVIRRIGGRASGLVLAHGLRLRDDEVSRHRLFSLAIGASCYIGGTTYLSLTYPCAAGVRYLGVADRRRPGAFTPRGHADEDLPPEPAYRTVGRDQTGFTVGIAAASFPYGSLTDGGRRERLAVAA